MASMSQSVSVIILLLFFISGDQQFTYDILYNKSIVTIIILIFLYCVLNDVHYGFIFILFCVILYCKSNFFTIVKNRIEFFINKQQTNNKIDDNNDTNNKLEQEVEKKNKKLKEMFAKIDEEIKQMGK